MCAVRIPYRSSQGPADPCLGRDLADRATERVSESGSRRSLMWDHADPTQLLSRNPCAPSEISRVPSVRPDLPPSRMITQIFSSPEQMSRMFLYIFFYLNILYIYICVYIYISTNESDPTNRRASLCVQMRGYMQRVRPERRLTEPKGQRRKAAITECTTTYINL